MQRLKNIEDNLNSNDDDGDNGNGKVGIFQIIKDVQDKGIKITDDDEAIREIREHIQNVRNEGVRVNNFDEMGEEIRDHIHNLKDEDIDVNINNDQVNDLVNKILKDINKRDLASKDSDIKSSFKKYENKLIETCFSGDMFGSDKNYRNQFKKIIEKSFNLLGSGLKILMLARLPILLAQIKAGNNSRELKNEIRQLLYSLYR